MFLQAPSKARHGRDLIIGTDPRQNVHHRPFRRLFLCGHCPGCWEREAGDLPQHCLERLPPVCAPRTEIAHCVSESVLSCVFKRRFESLRSWTNSVRPPPTWTATSQHCTRRGTAARVHKQSCPTGTCPPGRRGTELPWLKRGWPSLSPHRE